MDRSALIDDLPDNLAVVMRLHDAGHPAETVACALGIPVQSVSITLRVATLKLAELSGRCGGPPAEEETAAAEATAEATTQATEGGAAP